MNRPEAREPDTLAADVAGRRAPRLFGARARAGMMALADRCTAEGLVARVFGYPAAAPPDRDALVAGIVTVFAGIVGAALPGAGPLPG
ncbi:MAG: hypothetical protein FJ102_24405, partial [Deltaproteobacteria bacterium]|nr:hypothetical protein [Deltaproteobacteria bacterium]